MFENLKNHKKILVTGPHRSGTTFAATAIQHDLKDTHGLIREELCWLPRLNLSNFDYWVENETPVVIQAPFAADVCHQYPGLFVVFMFRNVEDIEASQERMFLEDGSPAVSWFWIGRTERRKYSCYDEDITVADMKYRSWEFQKERIENYLELEYESLSEHPLWVPKELRKDFHVRQTSALG